MGVRRVECPCSPFVARLQTSVGWAHDFSVGFIYGTWPTFVQWSRTREPHSNQAGGTHTPCTERRHHPGRRKVYTQPHTHTTLRNDAINSRKIGRCTVLLFAYDAAGVHTLPPPAPLLPPWRQRRRCAHLAAHILGICGTSAYVCVGLQGMRRGRCRGWVWCGGCGLREGKGEAVRGMDQHEFASGWAGLKNAFTAPTRRRRWLGKSRSTTHRHRAPPKAAGPSSMCGSLTCSPHR